MSLAHRHHATGAPLGWNAMNMFSLMFALLLALAFVVLLMLFFAVLQHDRKPMQGPMEPAHASVRFACSLVG